MCNFQLLINGLFLRKVMFICVLLIILVMPINLYADKIILEDHFDNNKNSWPEGETNEHFSQIFDGKYVFRHNRTSGGWTAWKKLVTNHMNFTIEASFEWKEGVDNYGFGLLWGGHDSSTESNYQFLISSNGQWTIAKNEKGINSFISPWHKIDIINKGSSKNILKIVKKGTTTFFYINDEYVDEFENLNLFGSKTGFHVGNSQLIAIDDFRVVRHTGGSEERENMAATFSDVDNIPSKKEDYQRENSYAVVVGVGKYLNELIPEVKYAQIDAEIFAKYLENISGIPRKNIKLLTGNEGTKSYIESYINEWLPRRVKEDSEVFVYFAGHGTPNPETKEAYLVPFDGNPDFITTLYPLKNMYESLSNLKAKQTVVMLDTCFSGAGGRSIIPKGSRPIILSVENPILASGKITVLAASSGSQISSDYDKVNHGLFTYYLLKGMNGKADNNKNGIIELGELYSYVNKNVTQTASEELNRDQTPVLLPDINKNRFINTEIARISEKLPMNMKIDQKQ